MPVFLSAFDEFRLHVVQLVAQLLSHRLSQSVRFASREVGQQARQKHHLLLVDRDSISVLQIFLHDGNIVFDRLPSVFTVDKVGDIVHRSRTVERIHGDKVFECRRLEFAQILLHPCRFKLERSDCPSVAIQLVGGWIVNGYFVDIQFDAFALADILDCFLYDGQGLESQKVHLDKPGVFDDRAFILGYKHFLSCFLVIGRAYGHPVGNVIPADDGSAGMDARVPHVPFEHFSIFDGVAQNGIG